MGLQTETKLWTAEELWASGLENYELHDGRLVEGPPAGPRHGHGIVKLTFALHGFVDDHRLGMVFGAETGFRLSEHRVLGPGVSFVRAERIPAEGLPEEGFFPGPPDLAVEILSPRDLEHPGAVQHKVAQYLDAGTPLVWVLDLRGPRAAVYRLDGSVDTVGPEGSLSGKQVVPGFSWPLRELEPRR